MLKLKSIFVGVTIQIISFFIFTLFVVLLAMGIGDLSNDKYLLWLELASYASVIISSFIASRLAWERGAVYGLIIAGFWVFVRLLLSLCLAWSDINIVTLLTKIIILLAVGFVSGALGVSGKRKM